MDVRYMIYTHGQPFSLVSCVSQRLQTPPAQIAGTLVDTEYVACFTRWTNDTFQEHDVPYVTAALGLLRCTSPT